MNHKNQNMQDRSYGVLHLVCGLPGTGKTTLSKKIENVYNAIRLCPDQWLKEIWPGALADIQGNAYRDKIEQLQWQLGKKILKQGVDIVIEWGTWGRAEREQLRNEAWQLGAKVAFYYLEAPKEVVKQRIINRNNKAEHQEITVPVAQLDTLIEDWYTKLQPPTPEELNSYDFLG